MMKFVKSTLKNTLNRFFFHLEFPFFFYTIINYFRKHKNSLSKISQFLFYLTSNNSKVSCAKYKFSYRDSTLLDKELNIPSSKSINLKNASCILKTQRFIFFIININRSFFALIISAIFFLLISFHNHTLFSNYLEIYDEETRY